MKDYFIYDRANDHVLCFDNGDVIFFASLEEAQDDLYGNEEILKFSELPKKWQELIKKQTL
jgi:hypothetical protein